MPDLPLDDISLHYETDGDGPPLLLLAGMLSDSASWGPLVSLLAKDHHVIRPDNRTTGRTTPWDAPVSVEQMAQDALALLDHLQIDKTHVTGHSMGGLMAMEIAGLAPDRIASLTILASAPVRIPRTIAVFDMIHEVRAAPEGETLWLKALYPWVFRPDFFADPQNTEIALQAALAYPHAQSLQAMAHQIEALKTFKPQTRPADIPCPTQIVFAEHDLLIPEAEGRAAFSAIPNVTQHVIEDAGHSIHWDAPQPVANRIRAFTDAHPLSSLG
ncbi:alpha/beta fold hydrolase [Thalassococcus sp. S3]|uniref:alpha/beta fold hydrolase n=1 Tax=Thalassococcus sp. S3 TaxID=2017482 RepID=UPI0010247F73|nr:alpha/beta fold hydrolase [Thalassococcus sp. S3]QBF34172.1 lipolytic enzyme [Thalassococcus sp. S3]